jgi:hypothetical protein
MKSFEHNSNIVGSIIPYVVTLVVVISYLGLLSTR